MSRKRGRIRTVFEVPVRYVFSGVFYISADSQAQAEEFAIQHCGMTSSGAIHSSLPDEDVDWDFPVHPERTINTDVT